MSEDLTKYMNCLIELGKGPCAISDEDIVSWLTVAEHAFATLIPGTVDQYEITDAGRKWLAISPYRKS